MMKNRDKLYKIDSSHLKTQGVFDKKIKLVTDGLLKVIDMHALADYFRNKSDMFATGEFWGKIMRAACAVYKYSEDAELKKIIDCAATDFISLQDEDGDLSTVPKDKQPNGSNGSDLWERKYALMGLLSYYEVSGDPKALSAARNLALYTASQVGESPKTPITQTGWAFDGIESSSILEVIMRTYNYTGDEELLQFGKYIIDSGACSRENIFEAIRGGKSPYLIGSNGVKEESIAKAYEMMSCFDGLIEYYRATGDGNALETAKIFWDKVKGEEITLLGSGGADAPYNLGPGTGEQWNLTAKEQTNPDIGLMMETCVTVYWMRISFNLLRATGEVKYADAIEVSLYNAILGAIRSDGAFFEYFPKFNGKRNSKVNYSFNINGFDLSCCTANGPTGLAMFCEVALMKNNGGYTLNLYESMQYEDDCVHMALTTDYPVKGSGVLKVYNKTNRSVSFDLRVPTWACGYCAEVSREKFSGTPGKYLTVNCPQNTETAINFNFEIPIVRHTAPKGSNRLGDNFEAYTYGSVLLSQCTANGKIIYPLPCDLSGKFTINKSEDGFLTASADEDGRKIIFTDYMSAGNKNPDDEFMSWIPTV